jgi:hydroxymethylglutaryl-CoA synthase
VPRRPIGAGRQVPSYQTYLKYRGLVRGERDGRDGEPFTSLTMLWRERVQTLALHGVRCAACERIVFPARRICPGCGAGDALQPHKLARRGTLVTFTADHLYPGPESPSVMAVIDLDGGGRLFTQMTDCEVQALHVGMDVELTLRRFHEANGYPHYFWKGRPAAGGP